MLVAHLDTVHDEPVRDICTSDDGNILISPQGIGGVGAKAFCTVHKQHKLPNKHDAVYYRYANTDFETYITGKGFKTAQGSFSDISLIAPEFGIAAVNLSCGYHHAHTLHEYINRKEFNDTIAKVVDIIGDSPNLPRFAYIEKLQLVEPSKFIYRNDTFHLSRRISADLRDIYEYLLDFYSVNELEAFHAEFGNHIL